MKRIFIVGTARSGTTLVQSLLSGHPDVFSLPETHFFAYSIPKKKYLRLFHRPSEKQIDKIGKLMKSMELDLHISPIESDRRNLNQWTKYFLNFMDEKTRDKQCKAWIEKTPMHLHYIDLIRKNCPDCYFIHTLREPKANISALYSVSKEHPTAFKQASLEKAIKRYRTELKISEGYFGQKNHLHLHYEDVVLKPKETIAQSLQFLGLDADNLLENYQKEAANISLASENWKSNNQKDLKLEDKVKERLTDAEYEQLKQSLKSLKSPLLAAYEDFNS